jgi:hypothetical protein
LDRSLRISFEAPTKQSHTDNLKRVLQMSNFLDSKRLPVAALAFALAATSTLSAMADAPPGAYLQSTTKSQSLAGSAQKTNMINQAPAPNGGADATGGGTRYGQPLSDNLNTQSAPPNGYNPGGAFSAPYTPAGTNPNFGGQPNFAGQPPTGWPNQNPGAQQYQQPSAPYNGYAQQANAMPPNYPPQQQNFSGQPPSSMNGAPPGSDWQADYPSLNEMNGGAQQPQAAPLNANAQVNVAPAAAANPTAPAKPVIDDATLKTIGAVANTVLPIATTMIMNKMMYGTVAPGMGMGNYGYGYNPYGPMRNPMGGYGYNRPNMYNNGMMGGGGGLGGLLNNHF